MADLPPLAAPPAGVTQGNWAAACEAVRNFCRWHIAPSFTETVTMDGPGAPILFLRTRHLTAVESVTEDGAAVAADHYMWNRAGMVRRTYGCWSGKFASIQVTITHGLDTCPPEVLQVAYDMAKMGALTGATNMQAGPFGITFPTNSAASQAGAVGMSLSQQAVLVRYKLEPPF